MKKLFLLNACVLVLFGILSIPLLSSAAHEPGHEETPAEGTTPSDAQAIPPEGAAAAYQFKNEGIFGCNQVAGANASAGTMAAIGGVYVPVNDAAVTLNTGILVYKECVLRPLQDRLRESAMSALLKRNLVGIQTGRGGSAMYVQNDLKEATDHAAQQFISTLTGAEVVSALNPAFKDVVQRSVARKFQQSTQSSEAGLRCPYQGDVNALVKGHADTGIGGLLVIATNPTCNPYGAEQATEAFVQTKVALAVADRAGKIVDGFYPVTDGAEDPLSQITLTPASVVRQSFQTVFDSPVRQLESANDVGQMIGALFAGVTTQALTDRGGLSGLLQGANGQPSYLEQVTRESSQGVIGAAVNAALQILRSAREIESRYYAAMNAIGTRLMQTMSQLRNAERACWDLVVPEAQNYASQNGFQIQVATSTAFSQQVIDSQIRALAEAAATNIQRSQTSMRLIDQLIASVTNTASVNAQRIALQQLDNLVAQNQLHTQQDALNAESQSTDIATAMENLVTDTIEAWGDSTDPAVGWCNVNNSNIPRLWAEQWRR